MSCGVGRRHGSDPQLLWLWCRLAAVAPIRPLAWEPPYATRAALEKGKKTEKKKERKKIENNLISLWTEFLSSPNSYIEILTPNVMVLRGRTFGR